MTTSVERGQRQGNSCETALKLCYLDGWIICPKYQSVGADIPLAWVISLLDHTLWVIAILNLVPLSCLFCPINLLTEKRLGIP
jgi:hypothetical protein